MVIKEKDFKATVKAKLKEIKECNLDIAILRRLGFFQPELYREK